MRGLYWTATAVASASMALAQTPEVDLVQRALELRREGRDGEALALLERVWRIEPSPRVRAQMGFAEQALGRWLDADAHLAEALAAAQDPWVASRRAIVDEARREIGAHLGSLEVQSPTPGARLWLDGRLLGPLTRVRSSQVLAGQVVVELQAEGYITVRRALEVPAGGVLRVELAMEHGAVSAGGGAQRVLAWTALGGASAGLGVGLVLLLQRNAAARRWNDPLCQTPVADAPAQCAADLDEGLADEAASVVGFVAGALLLVTGVALLATAPSGSATRGQALWCGPGPGSVGVACAVRF